MFLSEKFLFIEFYFVNYAVMIIDINNESNSWITHNHSHHLTATTAIFSFEKEADDYGLLPTLIFAIVAGITSLITITGNLVVILSFILERSIRQPSNYFIASLAVSDLLIGTVSMPFYTAYLLAGHYWLLGEVLCDLWLSIDYSACLCSIYTVFCITVDRYCSVTIPAKYRAWRTNRKILLIIAIIWTIPVLVFFTSIFGWQYFVGKRTLKKGECTVQYLQNAVFNSLLQIGYFWVTLVFMCSLYAGIYRVAWRLQKKSEEKRKKIAQLIATTPTTKSRKVFLQRPENLGPPNKTEEHTNTLKSPVTFTPEGDQLPPASKLLTTTYFRITSSSSMALSSLTESEKSPTLIEESNLSAHCLHQVDENPATRHLFSSNFQPDEVFHDEAFPANDSRDHKHRTQSPNTCCSIAKETLEEIMESKDDGMCFAKSNTTETALSGLCGGGQNYARGSSNRSEDKIRFHSRKPLRNMLSNVHSTNQSSINTEDGSDDDSRNGVDSRDSSIVWREQRNNQGRRGEIFIISNEMEATIATTELQEEKNSQNEETFSGGWKSSLDRVCCTFLRRYKVSMQFGNADNTDNNNDDDPQNSKFRKHPSRREDRALKALRTITIILGAFLVCWTPWHVLTLIMGFCSTCVNSHLYDISYWFCYINSPMNPFCYAFANQQFKKTFVRIFRLDWQRT